MGEPMAFAEPELPEVPEADKQVVRNVIYTAWALHENGDPCVGWQVQTRSDGYLVLISFGLGFSIALQDLQLISDVNPLRIDSITVRSPESSQRGDKVVGAVIAVKVTPPARPTPLAALPRPHRS